MALAEAPLLADAAIKPKPEHIRFTRGALLNLLKIRASSSAFRLSTADEVQRRLSLLNTGLQQLPTLMVGHLDARGLTGGGFAQLLYFVNSDKNAASLTLPSEQGKAYVLHPVHRTSSAADPRPAQATRWDANTATVTMPARTAMVLVLE